MGTLVRGWTAPVFAAVLAVQPCSLAHLLTHSLPNTHFQRSGERGKLEEKCIEYCQEIDSLSATLEEQIERNVNVEELLKDAVARASKAEEERDGLEKNVVNLRSLVEEHLSRPPHYEQRAIVEQKFWDELATPEVLKKSRPP